MAQALNIKKIIKFFVAESSRCPREERNFDENMKKKKIRETKDKHCLKDILIAKLFINVLFVLAKKAFILSKLAFLLSGFALKKIVTSKFRTGGGSSDKISKA